MDGRNIYYPWTICTGLNGETFQKYTQRTPAGFKCCQFPDPQDIIYKIDADPTLIDNYLFITSENATDVNLYNYLKSYEDIIGTCKYFSNDAILSTYSTTSTGLASFMKTNFEELYDYTALQLKFIYVLFQQKTQNTLFLARFTSASVTCGIIKNSDKNFELINFIPKYISYEETENVEAFKYIPFCVNDGSKTGLKVYNIKGLEYKMFSLRTPFKHDVPCTSSVCASLTGFKSFAGQNILGSKSVESSHSDNESFHRDYLFYYILLGFVVLILLVSLVTTRSWFSKDTERAAYPPRLPFN